MLNKRNKGKNTPIFWPLSSETDERLKHAESLYIWSEIESYRKYYDKCGKLEVYVKVKSPKDIITFKNKASNLKIDL